MFDDGGYSIHLDDGGSPELNARWFGIKRTYITWHREILQELHYFGIE